ncbi:helix-turn-helix transcriptional regulator [Nocardia sp. alder85J]|uniref:helix-turn-helix transcriptional regulator n=1 Tax=Nocardia sp. alder85J TaxID=2862949 RepID=UPI001CD5F81E|nr:WYL domain-containing protein [Nocardia sp. alder85J]MCX4094428.1 WYL domain-containing protein [Nocardia sp. alder85J]
MRADRLLAVLLLMQSRGQVTAAEVAAELEVSVATARRDLEALSAAGIPVYSQPGRGGGWSLVGGARTDLSGLSAVEARALFLLAGPAAAASGEAKAALRKLVRALPQTFRAEAEAAARATMVDDVRWGARTRPRPDLVEALQTAVVERRKVRLDYTDSGNRRSQPVVEPWGVIDKDGTWYLVAVTARGRRTFRVDRMTAADPTGETFDLPADFALARAWDEITGTVEELRSRTRATLLIEQRYTEILRDHFGRHCHVEAELDDGRVRVRVAAPTPLDIARQLAGWGALIDVVEPRSVRDELHRIGSELAGRYGP